MSKKDADIAKLERMFQHHSLENLVFGSRSRNKNPKNEPIPTTTLKKVLSTQSKGGNKKKKETILAKKEEKKRENQQSKSKEKQEKEEEIKKEGKQVRQKIPKKKGRPRKIKFQEKQSSNKEEDKGKIDDDQHSKSQQANQQSQKNNSSQQDQESESEEQEKSSQKEQSNVQSFKRVLRKKKKIQQPEEQIGMQDVKRRPFKRRRGLQRKDEKFSRKRSDEEKEYSLNRIFRKTKKIDFPSIKLEANLFNVQISNFVKTFGHFDVVHCSLPIEIMIKLPSLKNILQKGFMFIWVERGEIPMGYHLLNRLGFDVIDQIMWIKTNQELTDLQSVREQSQLFSNCRETCLIGYKCVLGQKTEYCTKISNNLIFTPVPEHPLEKPQEIYQIGDLMMPGSKKIEIGYKQTGGWLTIKHNEQSLYRCHTCLKRNTELFLITEKSKVLIQCNKCLNNSKQGMIVQEKLQEKKGIKVINVNHVKQTLQCDHCKSDEQSENGLICFALTPKEVTKEEEVQENQQIKQFTLCKKCFLKQSINQKQISSVSICYTMNYFFPSKQISCNRCHKNVLKGFYFECSTNKKQHILCNMCFWENQDDHDWKFRFIYEQTETKVNCFSCGEDCCIPYWACQICQNWYWCGKCNQTENQTHAHYQRKHQLYLIV